ncbi:MAG TPA: hypothetical protein VFL84_07610, partial [Gammaproteobacteria bacterium]|nr:hypothetical protein [Gammaproteobacteria bacterium]
DGGETKPANLTLLCEYHHRLLHEGAFSIVKEADRSLRFVTADGRTIPRHGYRREDFVDGDGGGTDESPSAEAFRIAAARPDEQRSEVREPRGVYRLKRSRSLTQCADASSSRQCL